MRWAASLGAVIAIALWLPSCSSESAPTEPVALVGKPTGQEELKNIYALFVGVDSYQFSRSQVPSAEFDDLRGAVGDAQRFKAALRDLYSLEFDDGAAGDCRSENALSTTLLDGCATREEILSALDERIENLEAGDTLLFYFAGHGSQYRDDVNFDQASGYNGTILPYDARNPDGSPGEIFDIELRKRKDRATAKGLYFVSVFDSCNSGTATRDGASGQARSVPVANTGPPPETQDASLLPGTAAEGGYWVHLAAAQDGQEAQEAISGEIGERAGVFTQALIETMRMPAMRRASFGDIIREVQLRVSSMGHTAQIPSAEGELTASLGARSRSAVVFDVKKANGTLTLAAGSLSGMTEGSRFALYQTQSAAVAREDPIGSAAISSLTATSAELKWDDGPIAALPARLYAEEIAHFFPPQSLRLTVSLPDGKAREATVNAVTEIDFVEVVPDGSILIAAQPNDPAKVRLQGSDGTVFSDLGEPGDPSFAARLKAELIKIARVNQLLALRTTSISGDAEHGIGPVEFCIAKEGYRPTSCPPIDDGGLRRFERADMTFVTVINRGRKPLHIYVLAIDPLNGVVSVLPKSGEVDQKIEPDRPYQRGPISFAVPGPYRFVTIASERRIRVDALQQSGSGSRNIEACRTPLERLLCSASKGSRDPTVDAVDDWLATVSPAIVG